MDNYTKNLLQGDIEDKAVIMIACKSILVKDIYNNGITKQILEMII